MGPLPLAPTPATYARALLPRRRPGALPDVRPDVRPDVHPDVHPGARADGLPDQVVQVPGVTVDRGHLERYARVCSGGPEARLHEALPLCYPHLLGFGASLRLLLDPAFPFPLVGLVHVEQTITASRRLGADEVLDLHVRTEDLRPHRRGRQLDVVVVVRAAGEVVWEGVSTYLHREGRTAGEPRAAGAPAGRGAPQVPPGVVRWVVPAGTGRRYAAVSGDLNPLHLSVPTARALGFRRPIAHGLWTLARALTDVEGRVPHAARVHARLAAPLDLPGRARSGWTERAGGLDLAVTREHDGAPHLRARVEPWSGPG